MFRFIFILFSFIYFSIYSTSGLANRGCSNGYYTYYPRWLDLYVGAGVATLADVSTNTAGNPEWQALYNPLKFLSNYGVNFSAGIRPLATVPFIRNLRLEGEWQYRESRYNILKDENKLAGSGIDKSKIPAYGKIYIKNVGVFNAYYDVRWLSDTFFPYVGVGIGSGKLGVINVDFTLLPSGIGEEYVGKKSSVMISQFMSGLQYDTKIIKTSVFLEYRYTNSGSVLAHPTYNGNEKGDDEDKQTLFNQTEHVPPGPRKISFKSHAIIFGLKYYLY